MSGHYVYTDALGYGYTVVAMDEGDAMNQAQSALIRKELGIVQSIAGPYQSAKTARDYADELTILAWRGRKQ